MTIDSPNAEDVVTRRELDTTVESPGIQIAEIVADLEGCDTIDLSPIYDCIDSMIADLFSSPPPAEADAELAFTYLGYRIRLQQDGTATFRRNGQ